MSCDSNLLENYDEIRVFSDPKYEGTINHSDNFRLNKEQEKEINRRGMTRVTSLQYKHIWGDISDQRRRTL